MAITIATKKPAQLSLHLLPLGQDSESNNGLVPHCLESWRQ